MLKLKYNYQLLITNWFLYDIHRIRSLSGSNIWLQYLVGRVSLLERIETTLTNSVSSKLFLFLNSGSILILIFSVLGNTDICRNFLFIQKLKNVIYLSLWWCIIIPVKENLKKTYNFGCVKLHFQRGYIQHVCALAL